jgi:hypothetical protein
MKRSTCSDHAGSRTRAAVPRPGAPLAVAVVALMLLACLLVVAASAGVAGAAAKPGKPVAKAPKGTITITTPTFTWAKAKGAKKYEVRVSQGSKLVAKKTGVTKTSWKTTTVLPTGVALTWKVRGSNAAGAGKWSASAAFTVKTLQVGDASGGGIVAYIYQLGDPGYIAGQTHGLIVSSGDVNTMGIQWWNGNYVATGATGTALGTGSANTDAIISAQGATATSYAAGLARAYTGGGHNDWYLPSKDELNKVYLNKATIGGSFDALVYWTSSEASSVSAYSQNFSNGHAAGEVKQDQQGVRAARSF